MALCLKEDEEIKLGQKREREIKEKLDACARELTNTMQLRYEEERVKKLKCLGELTKMRKLNDQLTPLVASEQKLKLEKGILEKFLSHTVECVKIVTKDPTLGMLGNKKSLKGLLDEMVTIDKDKYLSLELFKIADLFNMFISNRLFDNFQFGLISRAENAEKHQSILTNALNETAKLVTSRTLVFSDNKEKILNKINNHDTYKQWSQILNEFENIIDLGRVVPELAVLVNANKTQMEERGWLVEIQDELLKNEVEKILSVVNNLKSKHQDCVSSNTEKERKVEELTNIAAKTQLKVEEMIAYQAKLEILNKKLEADLSECKRVYDKSKDVVDKFELKEADLINKNKQISELSLELEKINFQLKVVDDASRTNLMNLQVRNNELDECNKKYSTVTKIIEEFKGDLKKGDMQGMIEQLGELVDIKEKLESDNSELNNKVNNGLNEIKDLKLKAKDCESKLSNLAEETGIYYKELTKYGTEVRQLRTDNENLRQGKSDVTRLNDKCNVEKQDLTYKIEKLTGEMNDLTRKYEVATEENKKCSDLYTKYGELIKELERLKLSDEKVKEFGEKLEACETKLSELNKHVEELEERNLDEEGLPSKIPSKDEFYSKNKKKKLWTVEELLKKTRELIDIASDYERRTNKCLKALGDNKEEISDQLEALKLQRIVYDKNLSDLQDVKKGLQEKIKVLDTERDGFVKLGIENNLLKNEIDDKNMELESKGKEILVCSEKNDECNKQLKLLEERREKIIYELYERDKTIEDLSVHLKEAKLKNAERADEMVMMAKCQSEREELSKQLEEYSKDIEKLHSELSECNRIKTQLIKSNDSSTIKELDNSNKLLKNENVECNNAKNKLTEEAKECSLKLKECQEKVNLQLVNKSSIKLNNQTVYLFDSSLPIAAQGMRLLSTKRVFIAVHS